MAKATGGTVICPTCKREVGAFSNKYEPTLGIPRKHKDGQGTDCSRMTDGEEWVRWPFVTAA